MIRATNTDEEKIFDLIKQGNVEEVISWLTKYTQDINRVNKDNTFIPLTMAIDHKKWEIVNWLLNNKEIKLDYKDKNSNTILHIAAGSGYLDAVKYLIQVKPELLNEKNVLGRTVLDAAAGKGHLGVLEYLVEVKPELLNEKCLQDISVFDAAVSMGRLEVAKYLVKIKPCLLNVQNKNGDTALHIATINRHLDLVKWLVAEKPDLVYFQNNNGNRAVHLTTINKDLELAELLKIKEQDLLNCQNNDGGKALNIAVKSGNLELVKLLITEKPYVVNIKNKNGETALHCAAKNGRLEVVEYLVQVAPNLLNIRNARGEIALHSAADNGHLKVVQYLLADQRTDVHVKDQDGDTVLHFAADRGHVQLVKWLVTEQPDLLNVCNNYGLTALHFASDNGHLKVAKCLLADHRTDVNVKDQDGDTVLYVAASNGHLGVVEYLVSVAPELLNEKNQKGNTVLYIAAHNRHSQVVKWLVQNGADLSFVNNVGRNIFSFYPPNGDNLEMFEFLLENGADLGLAYNGGRALQRIANSVQSAHQVKGLLNNICYESFFDKEGLMQQQKELNIKFNNFVQSALLSNQRPKAAKFQKLFIQLVDAKMKDYQSNTDQGSSFIKDLLNYMDKETKFNNLISEKITLEQKESLLDKIKAFIASDNKEVNSYFNHLNNIVMNLINSLKGQFKLDNVTIDLSLVIPIIIMQIVNKVPESEQDEPMMRLIIEAIDAATMYNSGEASCTQGQLNKLGSVLIGIVDEPVIDKQVIKQQFAFEGFRINYSELMNEIFKITGNNEHKHKALSEIEAQKIRSAIYKIMKQEGVDNSNFGEIFFYGEGQDAVNRLTQEQNIQEFKRGITYEQIYKIQQKILGNKIDGAYTIDTSYLPLQEDVVMKDYIIKDDVNIVVLQQGIQIKLYDINSKFADLFKSNKQKINDLSGLKECNDLEGNDLLKKAIELLLACDLKEDVADFWNII